jgi:chemotaxis signal transduction protein
VRHVARVDQLRSDDAADGRAGVIKLGGQLVPVFLLRSALGLPDAGASLQGDQHIAVTGDNDALVGWIVDRVTRESDITGMRLVSLPRSIGGNARNWFEGVALCGDGNAILLVNCRQLNPLRRSELTVPDDAADAVIPSTPSNGAQPEPVALVFSTTALPRSAVDKFAVSGRQVAAIVQPTDFITVPGSAPHITGVTIWRDAVVPIVNFSDASRRENANRRRLIARCGKSGGHSLIAMSIDADIVMHRPAADNRLLDDVECPRFSTGVFDLNGDRVALLDLDALAKFEAGREN